MKPEEHLQFQVAEYLRRQYPNILWFHVANERSTAIQQLVKLKRLGVLAGVPDVLIFEPYYTYRNGTMEQPPETESYNGLAIELKIKPNKTTPAQDKVLDQLESREWQCSICYDFETAKKVIDQYMKHSPPNRTINKS